MSATRLQVSGNVVLNGSGYGTVRFAPTGTKWQITSSRVSVSSTVNEAQVRVYSPYIGALYQIEGTEAGSTGDTSDTVIYLEDGQAIIFEWSGGDAGATATVVITGWQGVDDGRGFRAIH